MKKYILTLLVCLLVFAGCASPTDFQGENRENLQAAPSREDASLAENPDTSDDRLYFTVLDVGQGLSVLVSCQGKTLLFDGGDADYSSFVVSYLKQHNIQFLDYVVASHYDADHLNGVIGAIQAFPVGTVLGPDYEHDSQLYQSFLSSVSEKGLTVSHPQPGNQYSLGDATFTVLAPSAITEDSNNNSIAIRIDYQDTSFLITGDAETDSEQDMIESGLPLSCDVLVAGHHGSASSTSWDFLQATVPETVVISCGDQNSYGHPHEETMEKLEAMEIDVCRTDLQGTLEAVSDGTAITWSPLPCNDYSSGDQRDSLSPSDSDSWPAAESGTAGAAAEPGATETTAESETTKATEPGTTEAAEPGTTEYILNTNTGKFHLPSCRYVKEIHDENRKTSTESRQQLMEQGYDPCKVCIP